MIERVSRVAEHGPAPVSVRLDGDDIEHLEGLALIDGTNLAEQLRRAVGHYQTERRSADTFPSQVEAARIRLNGILDHLQA